MDKRLRKAYSEGMQAALENELGIKKEAGPIRFLRGIPRAMKGGMYGGGAGALHGAITGEDENAILRNALTGAMIGGGAGFGTRHMTKPLSEAMQWTRRQLPAMTRASGGEQALRATGDVWKNVLERPGQRAALARTMKGVGLAGGAGFVGSELAKKPLGVGPQPTYDQLYKHYLANMQRMQSRSPY